MKKKRLAQNSNASNLRLPSLKARSLPIFILIAMISGAALLTVGALASGKGSANNAAPPANVSLGGQQVDSKDNGDSLPDALQAKPASFPRNQGKRRAVGFRTTLVSTLRIVDDDFPGGTPCPGAAYSTIQSAINVSSAGDTIQVCAGTYPEEINIDRQLTLLGPNANINPNNGTRVAEAIIVPTFSDPVNTSNLGPLLVTLAANGVTFNGFTVDGDNPSLTSGVVYNGVDVDAEFGIYGTETANPDAVLNNNIVKNIGEFAIFLSSNNVSGARDAVSQISSNKVDNVLGRFGQGIRISDDAWASVLNNVVTRVRNGIVIENFSGNVSTHPASVIGDNSVSSFRIGIRHNLHYGYGAPGFTISNNTVRSYVQSVRPPQVTAIEITPTSYQGIRVESIQGTIFVTVSDNNLSGNRAAMSAGGYTRDEGLDVTNASATSPNILFSGNGVTDYIRGAYHETTAVPTFTCNSFSGNTTGLYIDPAATNGLIAHNNNIAGNGFGMKNDGPATVNAQANWWGAANGPGPIGPGSGDNVSANVDFSNWLTSASNCPPVCPTNVALPLNGSTAVASSEYGPQYPAGGVINGEHDGNDWGANGGWNDGTFGAFPDNVQVDFNTTQTISEIDVYTLKDDFNNNQPVTDATTFTAYGATAYDVEYWSGSTWVAVAGGNVTGNNFVKRKFIFPSITTDKVRVVVNAAADGAYSRIVEVEAFSCSPAPTPTPTPTPTATPTPTVTPTPSPSPTPVPGCVTAPSGMAAWYPFDGNTTDVQNGNNAVPTTTPIFEAGEVAQAINFNGTYYAQAPTSGTLDFGATGTGLTIDTWIKPAGGRGPLVEWNVGNDGSSDNTEIGVHLWLYDNDNTLYANIREAGGTDHPISATGITVGVYQHVAVTYDKTSGAGILYINGAQAATLNFGTFNPKTSGNLNIAHRPPNQSVGGNWNGSMDELEIFNRALSGTEIAGIWSAGSAGKCKGPCTNTNVALATNGSTAVASSEYGPQYPAGGVINGEHDGNDWGANGGWNDGTFGVFPDNVEVHFNLSRTIGEIDVYTLKDDFNNNQPVTGATTFTAYGATAYDVQYWTGSSWATVTGGSVTGNNLVKRTFTFTPVTTTMIRVVVNAAADGAYSRLVEVEAFACVPPPTPTPTPTATPTPSVSPTPTPAPTPCASPENNVALATNGSTAVASSELGPQYPAAGVINGEHDGNDWGANGGWNDGTFGVFPDDVEVDFNVNQTIGEIDVYTLKDDFNNNQPASDATTFTAYGATAYDVQYWTGSTWANVPGGVVTGNNFVKRKFIFPNIATDKIRVVVHAAADGAYSRIVEVEAFSCTPIQVLTVDDDQVQCPNAAYTTITQAIAAASAGDLIKVCAGTYNEQVNVDKTLTLHGAQSGNDARSRSTALAQEAVINQACGPVRITADDVTVDGFIIQGASSTCSGTLGAGIHTGSANDGHQILNNIIQNNPIGVFLNSPGPAQTRVEQNLIRNNNNTGAVPGTGIYSELGLANALITKNTFANHDYASIYFPGTQSGLTISDNDLGGGAVLLANTSTSSITGNTSTGNTGFFFGQIRLYGNDSGISVSCNLLSGGEKGIRVSNEGSGPNSSITINNNNIQGHVQSGLQVDAAAYTGAAGSLDATNNYWGDPSGPNYNNSGPGTGDKIDDPDLKVNYTPFSTVPTACAAAPPTAVNTLVVDDDFPGPNACANAAYSTVNAAIAAAGPNDVIKVCAGTYNEQINVNQSLTLLGAQNGQNARTRNTTAAQEAVINDACGPVQISADDVVIDGFTIQGASGSCGTSFLSAIYMDGSTGGHNLRNNIIQNNTQGMFLNNDSNSVTVQSNLFRNNNNPGAITGTGIYSANGLDDALIDNNTFLGHNWGSIYFDGTSPATNVSISGNDLGGGAVLLANTSNSFVNGNTSTGNTGNFYIDQIRFFGGSSNNDVSCNHLTGGERAIRLNNDGYGANSGFTINNNHLRSHLEAGLRVDSGAYTGGPLNATNNYWGDPGGPRYNGVGPAAADNIVDPGFVVNYTPFATSTPGCAAQAATTVPSRLLTRRGVRDRNEMALSEKIAPQKGVVRRMAGKPAFIPTR